MSTYPVALTAFIDRMYAEHVRLNQGPIMSKYIDTRDQYVLGNEDLRISSAVMEELIEDEFDQEVLSFGDFDNCREQGMTVSAAGWTFCVYEHRNSDEIHIEGCPNTEIQAWGPYGGRDKWDTLFHAGWREYHVAAWALARALRFVVGNSDATRKQLVALMHSGESR